MEHEPASVFSVLPSEIIENEIVLFLTFSEFSSLRLVSKSWNRIYLTNNAIWFGFVKQHFDLYSKSDPNIFQYLSKGVNWRKYFVLEYFFHKHVAYQNKELKPKLPVAEKPAYPVSKKPHKQPVEDDDTGLIVEESSGEMESFVKLVHNLNQTEVKRENFDFKHEMFDFSFQKFVHDLNHTELKRLPRLYHSKVSVVDSSRLVFVGGYCGAGVDTHYPLIFEYNFQTASIENNSQALRQLARLQEEAYPPATLWRHNTIFDSKRRRIICSGGMKGSIMPKIKYNKLFAYHVDTKTIQFIQPTNTKDDEIPCVRTDHAVCLVDERYMYIFGGSSEQTTPLNDLFYFDLENHKWHKVQQHGTIPEPRSAASMEYISRNRCLILRGGANFNISNWIANRSDIHMFSLDSNTWVPIIPNITFGKPVAGAFAGTVKLNHYIISFMGGNITTCTNEVLVFNTVSCTWYKLQDIAKDLYCTTAELRKLKTQNGTRVLVCSGFCDEPLNLFSEITIPWYNQAKALLRRWKQQWK